MIHHRMAFSKTAHYYSIGQPQRCGQFIMGFHGYGQLAKQFIKKMEGYDAEPAFILAPEGLSRFYWDQEKGQVGASWMTKEDRLIEIADNARYLSELYAQYESQLPAKTTRIALGFSQGAATLIRWLHATHLEFDALWLWGAGMPMDLDYQNSYWDATHIRHFWGKEDPYLNTEQQARYQAFLKEQGIEAKIQYYDGGHGIDKEVLHNALAEQ